MAQGRRQPVAPFPIVLKSHHKDGKQTLSIEGDETGAAVFDVGQVTRPSRFTSGSQSAERIVPMKASRASLHLSGWGRYLKYIDADVCPPSKVRWRITLPPPGSDIGNRSLYYVPATDDGQREIEGAGFARMRVEISSGWRDAPASLLTRPSTAVNSLQSPVAPLGWRASLAGGGIVTRSGHSIAHRSRPGVVATRAEPSGSSAKGIAIGGDFNHRKSAARSSPPSRRPSVPRVRRPRRRSLQPNTSRAPGLLNPPRTR
jgi:hypothetical protein